MQFSGTNQLYGTYSRYRIGNEDGPPYFPEYANAASPTRPYVTQFSHEAPKDSNATGNSRMRYDGFASLPAYPRYDGTYSASIQEFNVENS